jgi:hypothetical protein
MCRELGEAASRGLKRIPQSSDGKEIWVFALPRSSLFQEMNAFVALHLGYEPVRKKLRQDEKVARRNWRSNLPEISR